jgi:polysaccharide biosynthesis protein VpsQ
MMARSARPFHPMRINMIRLSLFYLSFILCVILLADSGHLPRWVQYIHDLPHVDKVIHFSIYGTLALCINLTLASKSRWSFARAIVTGSILVLMLSTLDETTNPLVRFRDWSLGDLAANYLGVICVGMLPMLGWPRKPTPPTAGGGTILAEQPAGASHPCC